MSQTILITGSSAGIGRQAAIYFQRKGWNVIASMRRPEKETQLNQLDNVLVTRLDVTDESSIKSAIEAGIARFGKIDALVNNAGYGVFGPVELVPLEKMKQQFEVNVFGLLATTQAIVPHFRENGGGMLINLSSVVGKFGGPFGALYHGSKFAVEGISESLMYELAPFGIAVKIVEPGPVATDFVGRSLDAVDPSQAGVYAEMMEANNARFAESMRDHSDTPDEIAEVIYAAATDGTDKLRYPAGEYSKTYTHKRDVESDEKFLGDFKKMLPSLATTA